MKRPAADRPSGGGGWYPVTGSSTTRRIPSLRWPVKLRESWSIGEVEVPTRVVLAPMAGVSVQAFRRQGRRFGAGLVCSEMVSCAGIEHRNERTLGYLRVARRRASARDPDLRLRSAGDGRGGADGRGGRRRHRRHELRLPRPEGDEDGRRRAPARGSRSSPAGSPRRWRPRSSVPVTVKMRRGVEDGSRACLELGPRLVDAGAAALTLHPRSAKQMYTGYADHTLTAELVELVDVPVIASGDVISHAKAQAVLERDRRGRGHGRPRRAGQSVGDPRDRRGRRRRADARRGGRGADPVHPRNGARAR